MTHPSDITNGASLEDCHTNLFALADLSGMKWRCLTGETTFCIDPLDDPVLSSYSRCLAADVLCVWRRVKSANTTTLHELAYSKELWIFWYHIEPDLTNLVHQDLTESDEGCWENGISYECRTLLFKALHNLIERGLLARGFSRLGKWFVQPYDSSDKNAQGRPQYTFSFNFFVYGDSTVCASVDVRQHPAICRLSKSHLTAAQESHAGLKVLLSPYGLCGTLTGRSSKETDRHGQRFLQEWYQFYPQPSPQEGDSPAHEELLPAVEVIVGGMKMRYPASYVYVSECDDPTVAKGPSVNPLSSTSSSLLTPPMSPCDHQKPLYQPSALKSTLRIKHQVWKDAITVVPSHETAIDDPLGQWNFCDASSRTNCSCSRCSKSRNQAVLKPGESGSNPSSTKQRLKNLLAFHRRTQETVSAVELDNYVAATPAPNPLSTTTIPTSTFQYKVPGTLRSTTPNGLPQLFGQPSIIGSPHPSTLLLDGPNSSTDPTMPTLSPHPPPLHREEGEEGGGRPAAESMDQTAPPSTSQSPITLPEVKTEAKPPEQVFSPYQMTLEIGKGSAEGSPAPAPPTSCDAAPQQGLKPPVLPVGTTIDPEETNFNSLLYDYSSLTQPLWEGPPPKRQRRMHKNWSQKDFQGGSEMMNKDALDLPLKPKDPYEFNDEFDESSPSSSFRNKLDVFIKEEASTPTAASTPQMGPLTPKPALPPQDEAAAAAAADLGVVSPPTPRNQAASLTREEDLQVTEHDLEQLFDTSSDESVDVVNYPPSGTPGSTKLGPTTPEEFPVKPSKNTTAGILCPSELQRMFPTPPSLDNNTASSPCAPCTDPSSTGAGAGGPDDLYPCSPAEAKDWSYVYKPQVQAKFVGSSRYAPLASLPSSSLPALPGGDYTYKLSWHNAPPPAPQTHHHPTSAMDTSDSHRPPPSMMMVDGGGDSFMDHHRGGSYDLPPGGYKAALHHHPPAMVAPPPSTVSPPETSGLLVNLILSDSLLNVFKDHNFSSCTLCVCNMDIRGCDASLLLPSHLGGPEEPQEKCTCGFSAVVNRHQSYRSGLFYEDEVEITGFSYEPLTRPKKNLALVESRTNKPPALTQAALAMADQLSPQILDLIKSQCSILNSPCTSFSKSIDMLASDFPGSPPGQINMLEHTDGCEVTYLALEAGKQAFDNIASTRMEENVKNTCLHKWPYLPVKSPSNTSEIMQLLRTLQPLLQECFKKRQRQGLWEVTYTVSGPLTWRQFHRLSEKGTEDQCEPQPIPTLLVGYDKDWLTLSPFAFKFWDQLMLEPSSSGRDVAYVVVAPDNQYLLQMAEAYFRELSVTYEAHRLGRHCALPGGTLLREGILPVSGIKAESDSSSPLDDWFNIIGDGTVADHLRLYAQACRLQLAPHLAMQQLDSKTLLASTAMNPPPAAAADKPEDTKPVITDSSEGAHPETSSIPGDSGAAGNSMGSSADGEEGGEQAQPTIVVYLVEPFTLGSLDPDLYRLAMLGLLRCYTQLVRGLPAHLQHGLQLQLVSLDSIFSLGDGRRRDQLKALAFSVYSQCRPTITPQPPIKSLTGFGPAATQDLFLRANKGSITPPHRLGSLPYFLAPQKNKQTELGEMFGDRKERSNVLVCSYCLTEDQRWLLATCTNDRGDLLEAITINIEIPFRTRRRRASARKMGLQKLFMFLMGVMSQSTCPWRVVVARLGRMGQGELREWGSLLGRKSLLFYSNQLRELCQQCCMMGPLDTPAILSACLVALEPDTNLRIMADQFTPDDRFSSSCNSCDLSTPQDASCTHILVFPTSATARPSKPSSQQEHIDALSTSLVDEDFFQDLNEEDITTVGQDINDLLGWTDGLGQSPTGSPHRSQPGSPGGGMGGGAARGGAEATEERLTLHQQPLALGYYVSTAPTGPMPRWFWASCPHLQQSCPVFLRCSLLVHSPQVQQNSDELLHASAPVRNNHPLDSSLTSDVLRYVLEGFNALSWLSLNPSTYDRRSCLPIHMQVLMQLYYGLEALV